MWWCLIECASSCFRVLVCAFLVAGRSGWMLGMSELKVLPVLASRSPNFACSDGLLKDVSCICPRTSSLFCMIHTGGNFQECSFCSSRSGGMCVSLNYPAFFLLLYHLQFNLFRLMWNFNAPTSHCSHLFAFNSAVQCWINILCCM